MKGRSRRTRVSKIRFTDTEADLVTMAAAQAGLEPAVWVRQTALGEAAPARRGAGGDAIVRRLAVLASMIDAVRDEVSSDEGLSLLSLMKAEVCSLIAEVP